VNDLTLLSVSADVVPDLGNDDRAVHGADRSYNIWRHRREGLHVEFEQFANRKRAAVALGLVNRTDEGAELAVAPMISAGEMRALAIESGTACINHHAVGSGLKRENFTSHMNLFLKLWSE
jgi:hypothetical protein